jgi:hypothetical protein
VHFLYTGTVESTFKNVEGFVCAQTKAKGILKNQRPCAFTIQKALYRVLFRICVPARRMSCTCLEMYKSEKSVSIDVSKGVRVYTY